MTYVSMHMCAVVCDFGPRVALSAVVVCLYRVLGIVYYNHNITW